MNSKLKNLLNKLKSLDYSEYALRYSTDYIDRSEEKLLIDYITKIESNSSKLREWLEYYINRLKDFDINLSSREVYTRLALEEVLKEVKKIEEV